MAANPQTSIGVVGTGAMGRGIAQLFAQTGYTVYCFDSVSGTVDKAIASIANVLSRKVEKGSLKKEEFVAICDRIRPCSMLADLAGCNIIVEAIVEDIEPKRQLFRALEDVVSRKAIIASNTSSLGIAQIAAACSHPERVAGLHFFNPVPLMKIVEVVAAVRTEPHVTETLRSLVEATGHRAVVVVDQPGFLVNHAGRGFGTEGLRILEERVADPAEIDCVLCEAAGFRMGPFELVDLTGLDVSGKVMTSIYEQFHHEPRFRPSSLVAPRVAAGLFGRKAGAGWYRYDNEEKIATPAPPVLAKETRFWVDPEASGAVSISSLVQKAGGELTDTGVADVLIVQPWGLDATTAAIDRELDAKKCVALDPLPDFNSRRTLMLTAVTTASARDASHALFASDRVGVTVINDSPGFITQRVIATIVNIAANIAQLGIGSPADIEDAVRLGLGYPVGPLSWGDMVGGTRIMQILQGMLRITNDPRYRPSPWLARRAALGVSLLTPETQRKA